MTSRTIDIHCQSCRKYMFSLQPDNYEGIAKDYYCGAGYCKQQATVDKLKDGSKKISNKKE